jgi:hypothetical protein
VLQPMLTCGRLRNALRSVLTCRYNGPLQCAKDVLAKDGLVGFMKVSGKDHLQHGVLVLPARYRAHTLECVPGMCLPSGVLSQ